MFSNFFNNELLSYSRSKLLSLCSLRKRCIDSNSAFLLKTYKIFKSRRKRGGRQNISVRITSGKESFLVRAGIQTTSFTFHYQLMTQLFAAAFHACNLFTLLLVTYMYPRKNASLQAITSTYSSLTVLSLYYACQTWSTFVKCCLMNVRSLKNKSVGKNFRIIP